MSRIIFVTGTDTGVGKTLLTASLLHYLRQAGVNALAMKPFCSGGTGDVDLLQQIQGAEHPAEEINPFYFPEPVAPYVAARWQRRRIGMDSVLLAVRRLARQTDCLLIEGAGGLLVPLGRRFTAADLIAELRCEVIVVGPNKLGIINHVMLTVEALKRRGVGPPKVVLMAQKATDASASSNAETLAGILDPVEIFSVPFLGPKAAQFRAVRRDAKKIKKTLARILNFASVSSRSLERCAERGPKTKRLVRLNN